MFDTLCLHLTDTIQEAVQRSPKFYLLFFVFSSFIFSSALSLSLPSLLCFNYFQCFYLAPFWWSSFKTNTKLFWPQISNSGRLLLGPIQVCQIERQIMYYKWTNFFTTLQKKKEMDTPIFKLLLANGQLLIYFADAVSTSLRYLWFWPMFNFKEYF